VILVIPCAASYDGPFADNALLAGFPVRIFGPDGKAGLNLEEQRSLALKIDGEGVVVGSSEQLDRFHALALGFGKLNKAAVRGAWDLGPLL
jgi:hypothetical protein